MNNKFALKISILLWFLLPALLVGFLVNGYFKNIFPVTAKKENQELYEVPKNMPVITPFRSEGKGALTILFNGGWESQFKTGFPELRNRGLKASVSALTSYTNYPGFMSFNDLKGLQDKGWEIISAGKTYNCEWDKLTSDQVREEVYGSTRDFLRHGIFTQNYASPCGLVDIRLSDKVAYYYKSQKIGEEGNNQLPLENTYTLKGRTINSKTTLTELDSWINQAKVSNQWVILTFNQISDSKDEFSIAKEKFKQFIDRIAQSNMNVVLPSQIIEYNKKEG